MGWPFSAGVRGSSWQNQVPAWPQLEAFALAHANGPFGLVCEARGNLVGGVVVIDRRISEEPRLLTQAAACLLLITLRIAHSKGARAMRRMRDEKRVQVTYRVPRG